MKKYTIADSSISGQGVFSTQTILHKQIIGLAFVKKGDTGHPDKDYTRTELGKFANHGTNPNMRLHTNGVEVYFVALRDVRKGEELTVDYGEFKWEGKRDFDTSLV